jgi:hypothetical protein
MTWCLSPLFGKDRIMKIGRWMMPVATMALVVIAAAIAQDGARERGDRGGDRGQRAERPERGEGQQRGEGQRGGFDPAQFQERMNQQLKEQLKVDDAEWQVLQPKIEKLTTAQRNARGGMMMGRGGFGDRPGAREGEERQVSELARASRELREVLDNESASAADVSAKLTAYRAARDKANAELEAARKELTDLLTQRQEAVLVMRGLLE